MNDALLVTLSFDLNKDQSIQKFWDCPWSIKPGMGDWLTHFINTPENYEETQFFDLDPEMFGHIHSARDLINPRNQGVFLIDKYTVMQQEVITTKVFSQSICFGVKEKVKYAGVNKLVKRGIKQKPAEEIEAERLAEEEAAKVKKKGKDEVEEVKPTIIRYEFFEDQLPECPDSCDAWAKLNNNTRIYFEMEKFFKPNSETKDSIIYDKPMEEKYGLQQDSYDYGMAATCSLVNG